MAHRFAEMGGRKLRRDNRSVYSPSCKLLAEGLAECTSLSGCLTASLAERTVVQY